MIVNGFKFFTPEGELNKKNITEILKMGVDLVMSPGLALCEVSRRGSSAGGFRRAGLARREAGRIVLRRARIAQAGLGPHRPSLGVRGGTFLPGSRFSHPGLLAPPERVEYEAHETCKMHEDEVGVDRGQREVPVFRCGVEKVAGA